MNDQAEIKKGGGLKFLLFLSLTAFIAIGGYSVYKLIAPKKSADSTIPVTATPTTIPQVTKAVSETVSPVPTDKISMAILTPTTVPTIKALPTNIPTTIPTKIPTPSVRVLPSTTIVPTSEITPTATTAVAKATGLPTQKPVEKLPDSGYPFPTIFLLSLGIIFILPIILLH